MNPLEYLEEGIHQGNWEAVCDGYKQLTGKTMPIPIKSATAEFVLRQIADLISAAIINPTLKSKPPKKKAGRPKGSKNNSDNTDSILKDIVGPPHELRGDEPVKTSITEDGEDASLLLDVSKRTVIQRATGETQFITNDPSSEEIEQNKVKAIKSQRSKIKLNRKTPKMYDIECNECEKTFKSHRQSGDLGQKCPKCLRAKKR